MAKPPKTTESDRRHVFSSFKERVDSIRIEPNRNLHTRAHDYVESSYFLAALEHWKEVNISGDFTDFLQVVEPLCQTLPQILHHQKIIFLTLSIHIERADVNSIQPLLELMTQFVHDLGPDFMPYYLKFLDLIVHLADSTNPNDAQNLRNSSNVLEWCFNCLAFTFKYLCRVLVADIKPTFNALIPIFLLTKKTYISRFCAEALSFLVRKLNQDGIRDIIDLTFGSNAILLDENEAFRTSMVTLYSEAMKNTKHTFHSKAPTILSSLVGSALESQTTSASYISVVCDILLDILHHGSSLSCDRFYNLTLDYLTNVVQRAHDLRTCIYVTQILSVMCFLESGRKITSWHPVFNVIEQLALKVETIVFRNIDEEYSLMTSLIHLFVIIIRNCDLQTLTRHFRNLNSFALHLADGKYYLSFLESSLAVSKEKMISFGATQLIQSYASSCDRTDDYIRLSVFLMRETKTSPYLVENVSILSATNLLSSLELDFEDLNDSSLKDILWKCVILQFSAILPSSKSRILIKGLRSIIESQLVPCKFLFEIVGHLIAVLSDPEKVELDEQQVYETFSLIVRSLSKSNTSMTFLESMTRFLDNHSKVLLKEVNRQWLEITSTLSRNFSLPNSRVREASASLLSSLYSSQDLKLPDTLRQMMLIDQIPLTVNNSNDIKMRIRQLFSGLDENSGMTELEKESLCHFVIGLLNNHFQPCWLAVYEGLPKLLSVGCSQELWKVLYHFLQFDFESQNDLYSPDDPAVFDHTDEIAFKCQPSDERLLSSFRNVCNLVSVDEVESLAALFAQLKSLTLKIWFKPLLRERVIKAINSVPSLAERNASELIKFAINISSASRNNSELANAKPNKWTSKDRMELVSTFSKFKNLKKAPGNEQLFDMVMNQLTSKQTNIQKGSLTVLFAWNRQSINKYKDNLTNLLDEKTFREELQSLVTKDSTSKIEDSDAPDVIPLVIRILYGRAKGSSSSSSKSGKKFAVANILPNLPADFIRQFLDIISENLRYKSYFQSHIIPEITTQDFKSMTGYLNMLNEIFNALGFKYGDILKSTIRPLIYSLVCAQHAIDQSDNIETIDAKMSRNVRQLGFKCLNTLFKVLEGNYPGDTEALLIFDNIVKPRLAKFSQENAQQPSSLMQIMLGWIEWQSTLPFLFYDDFAATRAIMNLVGNPHVKDTVINEVFDFCIAALTKKEVEAENFFTVLAIIVDGLLDVLPQIIETSEDRDINSKAASILLLIIEGNYIDDNSTRKRLVTSSTSALKKPPTQININDKVSILLSLSTLVEQVDCIPSELEPVIDVCSKAFRIYKDRTVRESLVKVFVSLGNRIPELEDISRLLMSLNSFSEKRMSEPNFERRLEAFREINENLYLKLNIQQWLPLLYCALFFINDVEELALRSNAAFMLMRFVDCFSAKSSLLDASDFIAVFKTIVLPCVRQGLRRDEEQVREEYVNVLAHVVRSAKYLPEFNGLKPLVNVDRDLDFFSNITHIQLNARQRAIRGLIESRSELSAECIYHYILPITEVYTICKDERLRNILDDTHEAWSYLVRCISWNHFRQLFKKHLSNLSRAPEAELRDRVNLLTRLSQALNSSYTSRNENRSSDIMEGLPDQSDIDRFIMNECIPPSMKILRVRNDETIIARTPLAEVAVNCLLCTSDKIIETELPGTLTSTCQVLRSHTQHLRDAVRKTLSKISKILGAKYFKFIIKELKTALSRGAQIHVLSYTVHSLMVAIRESFEVGDLDDSSQMIADIIMEDIFGAAGQEKDAEDYVSKMREVKSKKSYDTGELLSSNISLPYFSYLVDPIKLLLMENLPLITQRKLNELLRRYALGLNHNPQSSSREILILCHELHKQSLIEIKRKPAKAAQNETEDHFLVKLNAKPIRISADRSQYLNTLQKMSFELLRAALGRHPNLLTVSNIDGFVPLLELSMKSDDESLLLAVFKVLDLVIKLPFPPERDTFFEMSALKAFTVLQNSPTTSSEVCQVCLRYLATVVRHKPSLNLNDNALTFLLTRIMPDLEEPDKQALAFNFLKAVVSQHIMLPEVYDVMEKVATILVVNHSKEIRDMSRSIYFQFLMEYEQGHKKLDNAFKFLVSNLNYPTQFGRQSIMELMHSIVLRSSSSLLMQLATSFFVGLSNVIVSDESAKCREMAAALISQMMKKLGTEKIHSFELFIQKWITQKSNILLQRCALLVYKIYIAVFGYDHNPTLDNEVVKLVTDVLERSKLSISDDQAEWEDVYTSLTVISAISNVLKNAIFAVQFEKLWKLVFDTLLYPHTWVRLQSAKLVGIILLNFEDILFEVTAYEVQTIAYRTLRQLSAPAVSTDLSTQIVKNLFTIIKKWEAEKTEFINAVSNDDENDKSSTNHYANATDFAIARLCSILRQESHRDQNDASKTSAIQLSAMIMQILTEKRLMEVAKQFFAGLFNFIDPDNNDNYPDEIVNLARECLKILEDRIGITNYTAIHTAVKLLVDDRRYERKAKRAQLAISAPDVAARRKIRKHERFREKRKHEKDENGFYKAKKKRVNRV